MKCIKLFIFLMVFIVLSSFSLGANFDYNETGKHDAYFQLGTGNFNDDQMPTSNEYDVYSPVVVDGTYNALVNDLDNDGTNEIIVLDDRTLRIYHVDNVLQKFNVIDAVSIAYDGYYSNMIVFDIDDDGYSEVIIGIENNQYEVIQTFEYNGTDFWNDNNINYSNVTHSTGQVAIQCRSANRCLLAYTDTQTNAGGANDNNLYVIGFNSTNLTNQGDEVMIFNGAAWSIPCFNKMRVITVADYDRDGYEEFIFSIINHYTATGGAGDYPYVYYIEMLDNGTVELDNSKSFTDADEIFAGGVYDNGQSCRFGTTLDGTPAGILNIFQGDFVTPAMVFDIDGSSSNGLETVIAYNLDSNEYVVKTIDGCAADGCTIGQLDDYPESCSGFLGLGNCPTSHGLSNMVKADIFAGDDGVDDFCVGGFDYVNKSIDMICGSETSTWYATETIEFVGYLPYNISPDYDNYFYTLHTAQHSSDMNYYPSSSYKNPPEFISSHGVLQAINTNTLTPDLELIFENPYQNSALLSIDYEKIGLDDLVALTSTNLWYIDDQYSNSAGYIYDKYLDPICDQVIKINSTLEAWLIIKNINPAEDGIDDVQGRVILYYGSTNEQDSNWSANVSAGTTIPFGGLIFNKTIASGTLRIMGRDSFNPDIIDYIDYPFSVSSTGVQTGDCYTTGPEPTPTPVPSECDTDSDCPDGYECIDGECFEIDVSPASEALRDVSDLFGIGLTTFFLIIMIIGSGAMWLEMAKRTFNPGAILGMVIIFNFLMIMLGVRIGVFSVGTIIVTVIIGIIIIGVFLGKFFTGSNQ